MNDQAIAEVYSFAEKQNPTKFKALEYIFKLTVWFIITISLAVGIIDAHRSIAAFTFQKAVRSRFMYEDEIQNLNSHGDVAQYIKDHMGEFILTVFLVGPQQNQLPKTLSYHPVDFSIDGSISPITNLYLRSFRVVNNCQREDWIKPFGHCIPPYSREVLNKSAMRLYFRYYNETTYDIHTNISDLPFLEPDLEGYSSGGVPGLLYPYGGYQIQASVPHGIIHLISLALSGGTYPTVTKDMIREASRFMFNFAEDFIDVYTRVVIVEQTFLTANEYYPLFGTMTLYFEFLPQGGVLTTFHFATFSTGNSVSFLIALTCSITVYTWLLLVFSVLRWRGGCVLCCVEDHYRQLKNTNWYTCEKCLTKFDRCRHVSCLKCSHNVPDWRHTCVWKGMMLNIEILIAFATLIFVGSLLFFIQLIDDKTNTHAQHFSQWLVNVVQDYPPRGDFFSISGLVRARDNVAAVLLLFAFVEVYVLLTQIEWFAVYSRLFAEGAVPLMTFTLWFLVGFMGYMSAFHLILSEKTENFSTLTKSSISTFRLLLVDIPFDDMKYEDLDFIACLYISFGLCAVMISLNVFISIVSRSYEIALQHVPRNQTQESLLLLWSHVKSVCKKLSGYSQGTAASPTTSSYSLPVTFQPETEDERLTRIVKFVIEELKNQSLLVVGPTTTSVSQQAPHQHQSSTPSVTAVAMEVGPSPPTSPRPSNSTLPYGAENDVVLV